MTDLGSPVVRGESESISAETTASTPAGVQATRKRAVFAGYTAGQLLVGAAVLFALVWALWISKVVTTEKPQQIVKADLSRIVGEYVSAQARSATPPDQVQAQMRTFMASLDTELQRRGAAGQVVLVGEAVLSKSVPDITVDVAKAVYASGVKVPVAASPVQMGAMMRGQVPTAAAIPPVETVQPVAAPQMAAPVGAVASPIAAPAAADPSVASAMVSTFGGPGGQ